MSLRCLQHFSTVVHLSFILACLEECQEPVFFLHSHIPSPVDPKVINLPHRPCPSKVGARIVVFPPLPEKWLWRKSAAALLVCKL